MELLVNLFDLVIFKKKDVIIEIDDVIDYYYFIYKGLIRVCYFKNGKRVIERFEKEGVLFGGNFTHLTRKNSIYSYEAVEDVILLRIKYSDLETLCKQSHAVERLYRVFMEVYHANYLQRLSYFKSLSSDEKYYEFIKDYGNIANRVSLRDVASYLCVTPETLSRIRAKYDNRLLKSKQT